MVMRLDVYHTPYEPRELNELVCTLENPDVRKHIKSDSGFEINLKLCKYNPLIWMGPTRGLITPGMEITHGLRIEEGEASMGKYRAGMIITEREDQLTLELLGLYGIPARKSHAKVEHSWQFISSDKIVDRPPRAHWGIEYEKKFSLPIEGRVEKRIGSIGKGSLRALRRR